MEQAHCAGSTSQSPATVTVIMGVSGCGKSTVGGLLAQRLGCRFMEGDAYHPSSNIAKMQAGIPLTDEDRWPWLQQLAGIVQQHIASCQPAVLSCSALKPAYRYLLRTGSRCYCGESNATAAEQQQRQQAQGVQQQDGEQQQAAQPAQQQQQAAQQQAAQQQAAQQQAAQQQAAQQHGEEQQQRHAPCSHGSTSSSRKGRAMESQPVAFVLLDPPRHLLEQRLRQRQACGSHFMPAALLDSQLAALSYEESELALHVRGQPFPEPRQIVEAIVRRQLG